MSHDPLTPQAPDELLVTLDGRPTVIAVDHVTPASVVGTVVDGRGRGRVVVVPRATIGGCNSITKRTRPTLGS